MRGSLLEGKTVGLVVNEDCGRGGRGVARKEQGGEETFVVPKREMGVQENLTIADQVEVATRGQDIISDGTS